jgi:hypothetical protein
LFEGAHDDLEADFLVVGHLGLVGLVEGEGGLDEGSFGAQMIAPKVRMAMSSLPFIEQKGERWIVRGALRAVVFAAPLASEVLARCVGSGLLRHPNVMSENMAFRERVHLLRRQTDVSQLP